MLHRRVAAACRAHAGTSARRWASGTPKTPKTPKLPKELAAPKTPAVRKPRAKKEPAAETPTAESAYQFVAVKPSDESVYQQLTAVEHVLLRPGMYIGTTAAQTEPAWVLEGGAMAWRDVTYVPALLKLFDEVLVNALDNVQRSNGTTRIDVSIGGGDPAELAASGVAPGVLSVLNTGRGIPVSLAPAC